MRAPVEREAILPRIDGIEQNIRKLRALAARGVPEFQERGDTFDLAQHHLRLALEGVFHIGAHLLARLPGGRATEYREIARKLGELGLVPREFAEQKLVPMAGMRNVLVHQYADVNPARLLQVLADHLGDIEVFLQHVRKVLERPEEHGLTLA